jgi:hypothetical protein
MISSYTDRLFAKRACRSIQVGEFCVLCLGGLSRNTNEADRLINFYYAQYNDPYYDFSFIRMHFTGCFCADDTSLPPHHSATDVTVHGVM